MMIQAISGYKNNAYTSKRVKNTPQTNNLNFGHGSKAQYEKYFNSIADEVMMTAQEAESKFAKLKDFVVYSCKGKLSDGLEMNSKSSKLMMILHNNQVLREKMWKFHRYCIDNDLMREVFPIVMDPETKSPLITTYYDAVCFCHPNPERTWEKNIVFGIDRKFDLYAGTDRGVTGFHKGGNAKRIKYHDDLAGANYYKKNGDVDWFRSILSIIAKE